MALTAEERELLLRVLDWVGFKRRKRKTKALVRRFKSMFGEGPVAINKLFNDCRRKQPSFKEKYAFMTLQWLKTYAFEVDLAGRYGCCEPTVETKTKEYTRLFQSFLKTKVRFSGFDRRIFQYTCDGQNYNTYEFRMSPSSKWYNHKSHSSGVKYLYACHLYESRLVYMEGPVPCGVNDISMYKGGLDGSVKDKGALYYKVKGEIAYCTDGICTIPSHTLHIFVSRAAEDSTNQRTCRFGFRWSSEATNNYTICSLKGDERVDCKGKSKAGELQLSYESFQCIEITVQAR